MRRYDCRRNKPITVGVRHPFKVKRKLDLNLYMLGQGRILKNIEVV